MGRSFMKAQLCHSLNEWGFEEPLKELEKLNWKVRTMKKKENKKEPVKRYKVGNVSVAVWENEGKVKGGETATFYSISAPVKSYKDSDNEWQTTASLGTNDVPKAIVALEMAYHYVMVREDSDNNEL